MIDGLKKIQHLVVLTMENRSFDHYLGAMALEGRADIDGLTSPPRSIPDKDGNPVPAWDMKDMVAGYADPDHGFQAQHDNFNGGKNDGFVKSYQKTFPAGHSTGLSPLPAPANIPMGFYTRSTLPVLYALADQFTVCDHWFSSILSSTWPNRKYLDSGKRDQDNDTSSLPPPFPGFQTIPYYGFLEDQRDPDTKDRLTWKCYFSDLPFLAFWYKFAAFHALGNFSSIDSFVHDCREDTLPTVSILNPPFSLADDHPSHDVRLGQKFIGLVVDALTNSESWETSALVILYDENGAFYDHIPPPQSFEVQAKLPALDDPLGFRVPALVVSPYAQRGHACKTVYDHTSIMKSVSERWGIDFPDDTFGSRWRRAPSIWADCFDFNQRPLPIGIYTQTPADVAANTLPQYHDLNWASGIHETVTNPVGQLEGLIERIFILPGLKALDRRAQVLDHLQALEQHVVNLKRMT